MKTGLSSYNPWIEKMNYCLAELLAQHMIKQRNNHEDALHEKFLADMGDRVKFQLKTPAQNGNFQWIIPSQVCIKATYIREM